MHIRNATFVVASLAALTMIVAPSVFAQETKEAPKKEEGSADKKDDKKGQTVVEGIDWTSKRLRLAPNGYVGIKCVIADGKTRESVSQFGDTLASVFNLASVEGFIGKVVSALQGAKSGDSGTGFGKLLASAITLSPGVTYCALAKFHEGQRGEWDLKAFPGRINLKLWTAQGAEAGGATVDKDCDDIACYVMVTGVKHPPVTGGSFCMDYPRGDNKRYSLVIAFGKNVKVDHDDSDETTPVPDMKEPLNAREGSCNGKDYKGQEFTARQW